MTLKEFAKFLLDNTCPRDYEEIGEIYTFVFDLHCQTLIVTARCDRKNDEWVILSHETEIS